MTTGALSIQDNDTVDQYVATGESQFTFNFPILETDELKVSRNQVLLTYGTDYSITGLGDDGGGFITLLLGASTPGDVWTLWQDMPIERLTGFSAGSATLVGESLNAEFSARLRVEQQLRREIRNSLRIPPDDPVDGQNMVLPLKALRAGKYMAFDAAGLPVPASGTGNDSALRTDLALFSGASLSGFRRAEASATTRTIQAKLRDSLSILDFGGNGNGIANNDAAFTASNAAAASSGLNLINLPAGDYLVTVLPTLTAGVRLMGEGRIVTTTTHRRTWEYGGPGTTAAAATWFVNAATGNDANTGLTAGAPFKTLQRAWNQLPTIVAHKQTIQLADGTYQQQEYLSTEMERASVLWCAGKFIKGRTDQAASGADTTGYVVFKGTTKAGTIIQTFGAFIYGAYCTTNVNVGFDELTIKSNVGGTNTCLVAHRTGTYVQASNVDLNGNAGQAAYSCYAEAGGVLELTGNCVLSGSVNGVQCYDGSIVAIANTATVAGTVTALNITGGVCLLDTTVAINSPVVVISAKLLARGFDTANRVTIAGAMTLINSVLDATFVNFSGAMDAQNSTIFRNTCAYSNAWVLTNSDMIDAATPSFIAPAVASTVATPLSLIVNSRWKRDTAASSPINGSGGRTNAVRTVISLPIAANGATIQAFLAAGDNVHTNINGSGGNRINCVLAAVDSSYGGAPLEDTLWTITNTTANSVQIINGATASIAGGSILLGSAGASSNYKSIMLRWSGGLWHEVGRSLIIP